ncbi:MAG: hypothetical protein AB7H77_11170, partial [Bdellovibrionales bacterium]
GYQHDEEDYYKLAKLYRFDHQTDEAIRVIRDFIEDRNYKVSVESVLLAIQLLQEQDRTERAFSLAQVYLKRQGKENDAILFSAQFEAHGEFDDAYAILTPYLDNIGRSTDLEQQLVDVMLAQKKDDDVYAMLSAQRDKEKSLPASLAVTLTDLAVKRNDFEMIETLIRSQDPEKLPEDALLRYADMSFRLKRPDLAQIILGKLSDDYLRHSLALGAILNVAANDTPKNMAALDDLERENMSLEAKIVTASLYLAHNMSQQAFALLDNIPVAEILDAFDASQYAELYLNVDAAAKAEQLLAAARPGSTKEIQESIDQIIVLLAAGQGKKDFIEAKLAEDKGGSGDLWPNAYDLALQYRHDDVVLMVAEHLYKVTPSDPNRLQLAEALMNVRRYKDALDHVQALAPKSADARSMFLDIITQWGQNSVTRGNTEQQRSAIAAAVNDALKHFNFSKEDKRDLAFILEEIGFYGEAENIFVSLAKDLPYGDPEVENLLGFWEEHPSPSGWSWVENRAQRAYDAEKAGWLTYLNDNGRSQVVLDMLADASDMHPAVGDQYIEALLVTQNKKRLEFVLEDFIDAETNLSRLKKLAEIASGEDMASAAEKGWHKVYALDSNDIDAARELGLAYFDAGSYSQATPYLKQYLDHTTGGDYQVAFAYGEILQQQERKSEADTFYRRALQLISDIDEKDVPTRVDEAYLLYRTDHITESLTLMRQLHLKYPDDKGIRADYAEMLTEIGRFEEAAVVLSQ